MTKYDFASPSMNIAHTCGNVTAYVTDYIQTWFVPNYFKTVNVSSTMAYRYFNVLQNQRAEFFRKNKPFLIVQPRLNPDGSRFLAGTQLAEKISPMMSPGANGNLQPFIEDKESGYQMKFQLNRLSMSFDVSIVMDTQMEQLNIFNYLKNRLVWDRPLDWHTALESHIPREMIAAISAITGKPMSEPGALLHYLNSNTVYPVTYKVKNSTGNDEYFRYYPALLDAELTNLTIDSGSKNGLVDSAFGITFTINVEFNTAGLYHIMSREPIPKHWDNGGEAIKMSEDATAKNEGLRLDMLLTPYRDLGIEIPPGWKVFANPSFKITATAPDPDILDFSKLVSPSIRRAIDYHLKMNIPLDNLISIFVLKDYKPLNAIEGDFTIDFEELKLYTYNLNKTSTYRMLILVNIPYINELIKDVLNLEQK